MKEYNIDYSQKVIIQLLKLEGSCFSNIDNEFLEIPGSTFREYIKMPIIYDNIIEETEHLAETEDGKPLLDAIISLKICEEIFSTIALTPSIENLNGKIIQCLNKWKEKYHKKKLYIDFTFFEKVK